MQAKKTNKMRQFSSLLNEHWKRKQRLKGCWQSVKRGAKLQFKLNLKKRRVFIKSRSWHKESQQQRALALFGSKLAVKRSLDEINVKITRSTSSFNHQSNEEVKIRKKLFESEQEMTNHLLNGDRKSLKMSSSQDEIVFKGAGFSKLRCCFMCSYLIIALILLLSTCDSSRAEQMVIQSDPRPTIYSGQVSFGLLLSAHSSLGSELSSSASYQVKSVLAFEDQNYPITTTPMDTTTTATTSANNSSPPLSLMPSAMEGGTTPMMPLMSNLSFASLLDGNGRLINNDKGRALQMLVSETETETGTETIRGEESKKVELKSRKNRQIFDRAAMIQRRQQQQQLAQMKAAAAAAASSNSISPVDSGLCSQVNANALFAGMGAIWASHQANLVGDSHLNIGTYVYDSCNDLDIGQRQSVRIVSNLNAFQQTTCESPRGAPISLTIAHGDNQLRAIQLLTSFRVPVITTKEHFDLEDFNLLSQDQKRFLFSTAPSSRHLAVGALKFSKRIVTRSTLSHNLPNHSYKSSSKNGLIIVSNNLPGRFINFLKELIPQHVNYEFRLTGQPIDNIKSLDALEENFKSSSTSESRISTQSILAPTSTLLTTHSTDRESSRKSSTTDELNESSFSDNNNKQGRRKRDDSSGEDESEEVSNADGRMLSPTILMFITPSEAIDLVTRLRNDLAEVSRYYSLIVTTREDISPALKTIFHRGGSRLCSGKAFYTISPKPDDISEFSRYFRDTVQVEGDQSDHPLINEFAKYQSSTKITADLDEISTEPIIKAVWTAAAAFKNVHKRRCGSLVSSASSSSQQTGNIYNIKANEAGSGGEHGLGHELGANSATSLAGQGGGTTISGRVMNGRQSSKSPHQECMVKMNKEMAFLVQKELKKLDVIINSTGLQSLDDRRLKFDNSNELMTNKFSIKYINKECEITEIGEFMGMSQSALRLNEGMLHKSLESTLPDPWPIRATPPPSTPAPVSVPSSTNSKGQSTAATSDSPTSANADLSSKDPNSGESGSGQSSEISSPSESGDPSSVSGPSQTKSKLQSINDEDLDSDGKSSNMGGDDDEARAESDSKSGERASAELEPIESPAAPQQTSKTRTSKRSRLTAASELNRKLSTRHNKANGAHSHGARSKLRKKQVAAPVTAMGGRGIIPGVTDTEPVTTSSDQNNDNNSDRSTSATTKINNNSPGGDLEHQYQNYNFPTVKPMRKLKSFTTTEGTKLEDWLPSTGVPTNPGLSYSNNNNNKLMNFIQPTRVPTTLSSSSLSTRLHDDEQVDSGGSTIGTSLDLKMRGTTEAPVFSTLPESGGNTDLDAPAIKSQTRYAKSTKSTVTAEIATNSATSNGSKPLEVAATTSAETTDYVTSPSISKNSFDSHSSTSVTPLTRQSSSNLNFADQIRPVLLNESTNSRIVHDRDGISRLNHFKDLTSSPIPLDGSSSLQRPENSRYVDQIDYLGSSFKSSSDSTKDSQTQSHRSHLRWIYNSWFSISILGANICGALLTLYVLTFLLMKNCDGSLDRENQGMRSMHLLAIIIVFFGSTLFIVYPTPGLCLLRTSWHNFALVMLFGSLLLHAMQVRSLSSLGLGGRPNRLNQFLTLVFMVGVQVSFELQRWKYESANYMNFVNQYFGSSETSQKLSILSNAIANQFNPLNAFNDQVTPVSIQVSEQYQNLLHDYCTQRADDFIASQIYLCLIVCLLIIFSITTRKSRTLGSSSSEAQQKLTSALTSGKLVASQHEANLNLTSPSHFQFSPNTSVFTDTGNMFIVTIISAPVYSISIVLHIYGQNSANRDLISSVTMILIAFSALIGIFLPILLQIHRFDSLVNDRLPGTLSKPVITQSKLQDNSLSSPSTAFTMFPEFASTGLRRPSSTSGDSSSGGGSRRPFAETKESRRNMGVALANLGPSADSLRSMGIYKSSDRHPDEPIDPALLNMQLNLSADDEPMPVLVDADTYPGHSTHQYQLNPHQHQQQKQHEQPSRRTSKNEKRLIMLDVDPCCPRHGIVATRHPRANEVQQTCNGVKQRSSHCHQ